MQGVVFSTISQWHHRAPIRGLELRLKCVPFSAPPGSWLPDPHPLTHGTPPSLPNCAPSWGGAWAKLSGGCAATTGSHVHLEGTVAVQPLTHPDPVWSTSQGRAYSPLKVAHLLGLAQWGHGKGDTGLSCPSMEMGTEPQSPASRRGNPQTTCCQSRGLNTPSVSITPQDSHSSGSTM